MSSTTSDAASIVLATRNKHKVAEVRRILAEAGLEASLTDTDNFPDIGDIPETGGTFGENALLKARATAEATGLPAIADDSGLRVDALNGMPGVLSAWWAGRHGDDTANLQLLLGQLTEVPDDRRSAQYACAAALVFPDGYEQVREAGLSGRIVRRPRGGGGFGYDPVFVADGEDRTMAEMTAREKDELSHRGRAFRALAPAVVESLHR